MTAASVDEMITKLTEDGARLLADALRLEFGEDVKNVREFITTWSDAWMTNILTKVLHEWYLKAKKT